jgi:hypothetical protein
MPYAGRKSVGRACVPDKALLFCSVLYHRDAPLDRAIQALDTNFGHPAFTSESMPFNYTDYYRREMGEPLHRVILAFSELVGRDCLPDVKTRTNEIEDRFLKGGKRSINLDPGLLSLENICLATTKPYSHRFYLGKGIWAELTLIYRGNSYQKLEWTYPDYASDDLIRIFNHLRDDFKRRMPCRQA